MIVRKKIVHAAVALGLASGAIVATTGAAVAATPTCHTAVDGILPDGRLVDRWVTNTGVDKNHVSTTALPFSVDNMVDVGSESITGGRKYYINTFTTGGRPHNIDVVRQDGSTDLTVTDSGFYSRSFSARLVAGSGRYYVYGVDQHGNLVRWTREGTNDGDYWFAYKTVVARHMGGLKTLSYSWSFKVDGGWRDFLYGTTKSGALKQFQIPWKKPAKVRTTTIRKSGFSSYTGLSLAFCNRNSKYLSIIAIDRTHNRARWYTMPKVLTPRGANLTRRGLVAPGMDWRLHATF
jgi:hypothetical protein